MVLCSLGPLVTLVPWSSTFLVLAPLVPWCLDAAFCWVYAAFAALACRILCITSFSQVAFWLCGFWRLSGFGFLHPLLSQLVIGRGFLHPQFLLPPFQLKCHPYSNHHFFDHHGGANPPLLCSFFAPV